MIRALIISFRTQLLAFTTLLVLISSLAMMLLVLLGSGNAVRASINKDMGETVSSFKSSLSNHSQQLLNNARVLVADFGFKQAVASSDEATIASMLSSHSERVSAEMMAILDLNGVVVSSTEPRLATGQHFHSRDIIPDVVLGDSFSGFLVISEDIYQIAMVPVKTPRVSAITVIGREVTPEYIRDLVPDDSMHITFVSGLEESTENWITVSTLANLETMVEAIRAPANLITLLRLPFQREQNFSSREVTPEGDNVSVRLILSEDLEKYYETYETIRNQIFYVAVVILFVAFVGSIWISNRLTSPLILLAGRARKFAEGVYNEMSEIPATSSEIKSLLQAFRFMRREIAEREEHITYQATHDSLTGLLNRDAMIDAVKSETTSGRSFLLLGVNLVGFKTINDTLGMEMGDECLITVAQRLRAVASFGIASRHAADEFSMLVTLPEDCDTTAQKILMCQRILTDLASPMQLNGVSLSVEYRAGFVVFPEQADTPELLLRRGKIALEHAITTSTPLYFYKDGLDKMHLRKVRILRDLKETLQNDDNQLTMYYQPKMNLRSGQVEKAEALIRWFHPVEGFIPPDVFIALAEQTGMIGLVTSWVVSRVLDDQVRLRDVGIDLQLSINMSAQDLSNDSLRVLIDQKLTQNKLSARNICLEVTERDMMTDVEKSMDLLNYYRSCGFQLSIDDYGVGYSALSKLAMMPVHELKIDKCFIQHLSTKADDQIIVRSTISMAHELGLCVIAEGVEDIESQNFLQHQGCDYIQGYYLAKPMALDSLVSWIQEFRAPESLT